MKFKNVKTGAILVPSSEFVEKQMKESELYVEVKETKTKK